MKTSLFAFLIVFSTYTTCFADLLDWKSFFNNPSQENYSVLREYVNDSLIGGYEHYTEPVWKDLTVPYETAPFYRMISEGDEFAVKLAFQIYPIMSDHVGFLEAIYSSTSRLSETDPYLVLREMSRAKLKHGNGRYICKFLSYFGEEYVDRPKELLEATLDRKEILLSVDDMEVREVRDACVEQIYGRIEMLEWASSPDKQE